MLASCAFADEAYQRDESVSSVSVAPPRTQTSMVSLTNRLGDCHSHDALRTWLRQFARSLGFYGGRYVHIGHGSRQYGGPVRPVRYLSTVAREAAGGLSGWPAHDPVADLARDAFAPFTWSTITNAGMSVQQCEWLDQERARGIGAGIAVPIQDHAAGPAYLSLFGVDEAKARQLLDEETPELAFIGANFHAVARSLLRWTSRSDGHGDLTRREIECLRLAALGWTVGASATELAIAGRTVEFHLGNAAGKLGAVNKINAVAIAASERLFWI